MKRLAIATIILMATTGPAIAQGQFYFQVDGGAAFFGDNEAADLDIEYDTGFAVGGRLGVRATDDARVELEVSYIEAEIDEIDGVDISDVGLDADVSALSVEVGAYVDFLQWGGLSPYVGAGVGAAFKELDTNIGDDDDTDVVAHAEAGIGFDLTPNIEVVPHYRLVWLADTFDDEQFVHLLRLGVRLSR